MIIRNLLQNVDVSKRILKAVLPKLGHVRDCVCADALKNAIVTRPEAISVAMKKKLKLIIGKYIT
jgi:hypothetical protein